MKEYKRIEGTFTIYTSGKMFVDGHKLENEDMLTISVRRLKHIIQDAKKGFI